MALHKFTTTFQMSSLLPEDQIVNTYHYDDIGPIPIEDFDNVRDMLSDFWNLVPTGGSVAMRSFLASNVTTTVRVKAYLLSDPEPRTPVYESTFTLGAVGSGDPLPSEVALVLSFQRPPVSGTPQARRRNRVYLGPFRSGATDATGRPSSTLLSTMARAGRDLLRASDNSDTWTWVVHSPTYGETGPVFNGWIDNAWDTQRRRGLSSTARSVWGLNTP